jgi:hypothetical protein
MAARKNRVTLSSEWRERIRSGVILQRLEKAALGELEVSPTSLKAAEIVLRKTLPDLARTEVTGENGDPQKTETTLRWGKPID